MVGNLGAVPEPILHVDMDAFYASVEVRRDPSLAGRPVLVGGAGGRGVVASASYEARRFGVRSAMPVGRALRLCPHAVVVSPDFASYQRISAQLMEIFESVTPLVEPLSLDEAFCDVRGAVRLFGPPEAIGALLRRRIRDELGLPASVGIAPNKFLAKLCSGKAKPDGLLHLRAGEVTAYLAGLGVRDLWGVGAQTAAKLDRLGIRRVPDILATPEPALARALGPAAAAHLRSLARGEDPRTVIPHHAAKGMSAEETFDRDIDDEAVLRVELLRLAERVARRLRGSAVAARTVTLKVRYADFRTVTRSHTLPMPTAEATDLHREACVLLAALHLQGADGSGAVVPGRHVRLVGVGTSKLVPAEAALQLGLEGDDRWRRLERAADRARDRFGDDAVSRGALLDDRRPHTANTAPTAETWRRRP